MNSYSFPREIIKWIQSLNLKYSLRDLKRDLLNGYYIAEIIKKYHPRDISMHSFNNSKNREQMIDNWLMLEKTFKKIDFNVNKSEFEDIIKGNNDKLIQFFSKLYKFLTKKKIEILKKPLADLQNGKTKTFLLTETGLEKIDLNKKKLEITGNFPPMKNTEFQNSFENSENKENSQSDIRSKMDVSPLEIQKILDSQNKKNLSTKNQMQSKSKLRSQFNLNKIKSRISVNKVNLRSKLSKNTKMMQNENDTPNRWKNEETAYKMINERLNEYLQDLDEKYSNECFTILQNTNHLYYDYSLSINSFYDKFNVEFFKNIDDDINFVAKFIIKDDTELYKFFVFLINIVINLDCDKNSFVNVILLIRKIFRLFKNLDFEKCFLILKHFFINVILENLRKVNFEKKYFLIKIILFIIPDDEYIKERVFNLFINEKKYNSCIIEIISVFLENQKIKNEKNGYLLNRFIRYIKYVKMTSKRDSKIALAKSLGHLCKIDINFIKNNFDKFHFLFSKKEYCLEIKCYSLIFLFEFWNVLLKDNNYKNSKKKTTENSYLINSDRENKNQINFYQKIINKLSLLLEEDNEFFKRIFFINFGMLINSSEILLKFYFSKLLLCSEQLIEYIFSRNTDSDNLSIGSGHFMNKLKLNELKKCDIFLNIRLSFILNKNKNQNESILNSENQNTQRSDSFVEIKKNIIKKKIVFIIKKSMKKY